MCFGEGQASPGHRSGRASLSLIVTQEAAEVAIHVAVAPSAVDRERASIHGKAWPQKRPPCYRTPHSTAKCEPELVLQGKELLQGLGLVLSHPYGLYSFRYV